MRRASAGIIIVALSLWAVVADADAARERTLTGIYTSGFRDGDQPVRAVFTSSGEDAWDVAFYFKFNGADHVYAGTAEGSLIEGGLEGKVANESKRRTFVFQGEFKAGKFTGRHAEVKRRGERQTGTITLTE